MSIYQKKYVIIIATVLFAFVALTGAIADDCCCKAKQKESCCRPSQCDFNEYRKSGEIKNTCSCNHEFQCDVALNNDPDNYYLNYEKSKTDNSVFAELLISIFPDADIRNNKAGPLINLCSCINSSSIFIINHNLRF